MHVRLATVAALSLALVSTPAGALKVKKGNESWGKPGVTFAQYRADALECANLTYGAPIQLTPLPPMPTGLFGVALPNGEWLDLSPGHVKIYTTTLVEGVKQGGASAVLAASIFHFGTFTIAEAKEHLARAGVAVRPISHQA